MLNVAVVSNYSACTTVSGHAMPGHPIHGLFIHPRNYEQKRLRRIGVNEIRDLNKRGEERTEKELQKKKKIYIKQEIEQLLISLHFFFVNFFFLSTKT